MPSERIMLLKKKKKPLKMPYNSGTKRWTMLLGEASCQEKGSDQG